MHRIDTNGHVANLFNEGDPLVPRLPTQIDKHWLNAVQEEIVGVILDAGISLVKGTNTQLLSALRNLFVRVGNFNQSIDGLKTFVKVLAATKGITSIDGNTGNASLDVALYLNTSASAVGTHLWLEPKSTLPTAGLMGRVFMKTDGKLYVDNGSAWVVIGTQT